MAQNAHGVAMIVAGQSEEGIATLRNACGSLDNPRLDAGTLLATCELLAETESAMGHDAEAARWAEYAAGLDHPELPVFSGLVPLARAHALRAKDPVAAAARAEEAAILLAAGERRIDHGRALLAAGLAHCDAGRRDKARERLRNATDLFRACGARALEAKAIRERRRLGDRVSVSDPVGQTGNGSAPYGLSPRELEIAKLVAGGLTNQRIAERLFVSVRTVETHLSRVFAKLKVGSRVGVATKLTHKT